MEQHISLRSTEQGIALLGVLNEHARIIEQAFGASVELTADGLVVRGQDAEQIQKAGRLIEKLCELHDARQPIPEHIVRYFADRLVEGDADATTFSPDLITVSERGRPIVSKTAGQKRYVEAIHANELVFAIGPAGTGKTYLAVAMAVKAFRAHEVQRIILTRPAVEAGEKLGFLPGDLHTKVDPYMRPLYDALIELLGPETYQRHLERGTIEVSPLAYMRGRTLDDAFIILDEAQNTTHEQMKMFLTRIGFHAKAVVTGDITQIDLPPDKRSGLAEAARFLKGVEGVVSITLTERDVVRNPLVQRIIRAYEKAENQRRTRR